MSEEKRSEDELEDKDAAPSDASLSEGGAEEAPSSGEPTSEEEASTQEGGASEEEDAASPEAIARRVAALGEDDASEQQARDEERKLAERREGSRKGKKKGGLEAAASKKLSKIGTRAEPRRTVPITPDADPLIERTAKLGEWAKKNQTAVQAIGGLLIAGLLGLAGYLWYDHKREAEASQTLAKAVEAQGALIGEPRSDDEDDDRLYYKSFADRREAALGRYREVQSKFSGTGAAILARLAEGSLLLDQRDADGALKAYTDVKGSALAAADAEVKGRALEGIGFAHELSAAANPGDKDKHLEAALDAFKALELQVEAKGFKELALYHQARVLTSKGDKDKAKELLVGLKERLDKPEESTIPGMPAPPAFPFLSEVAMDRLAQLDPTAVPKTPTGGASLSPEQIRRLLEEAQKGGGN